MTQELVVHRGSWDSTAADLASVPVPDHTNSYVAVPYGRLVEEVKLQIPRFGLRVVGERFALAREGNQMFGVLSCRNGHDADDWSLAIGLRSSYDRSLAVGLVAGSHVLVCDNLAFHGETGASRKHTVNVFRDLPEMVYRLLSGVSAMQSIIGRDIAAMKRAAIDEAIAHHLMVLAVRRNALPASRLPKVIEAWDRVSARPPIPDDQAWAPTGWDLYNAFTGVQKTRSPREQMEGTLRLTQIFRQVFALS